MLHHFDNKRINLWLGSSTALRVDESKLDFLDNNNELESIDKFTIYTVLLRLFPNTAMDSYVEGSKRINQRRYLPIYLNNNVFNQSFSYTNLISAHSNLKIQELIDSNIKGKKNENYLLNDIKSFILKEENIKTIQEFEQAVDIINIHLGGKVSDYELIQLLYIGEKIEGFTEFANTKIFVDMDNVFGQFLRVLNMHYTRIPNDVSMQNDDMGNFFSRYNINELSIINKNYAKNKLIELYSNYLRPERTIEEASRVLFDCTDAHYHYFSLYLYYDEANELFIKYLKSNFKSIFLSKSPKEFVKFISGELMASIFINNTGKQKIKDEVDELIRNRNQWSSSDLDKKEFLKDGWSQFLKFFRDTYTQIELNEEEHRKAEKFYAFIYTYIKKGFIVPTEQEVLVDEILAKMREKNKRNAKREED